MTVVLLDRIARMLRGHRPLVLNWFRAKGQLSSSVVERSNPKAKLTIPVFSHLYHALEAPLCRALGGLSKPKFTTDFPEEAMFIVTAKKGFIK